MTEELNFSLLPNDELLTFSQRTLGIYSGISSSNDTYGLFPFVTKATASYSDFGKAFEREEKNPFTTELSDNDLLRDNAFLGFKHYIISCSFSRKAGWKAAAERSLEATFKFSLSTQSHLVFT